MKDVNLNAIPTIALNQTMTTLEIAELTDKQHFNVLRDVRNLIDQEAITAISFEASEYRDPSGKQNTLYTLDFQATLVLITGYNARLRARVIDRWIKLEKATPSPWIDTQAADQMYQAGYLAGKAQAQEEITARLATVSDHRLIMLRRASGYKAMGLTNREVGKLLNTHKDTVRKAVKQSRDIGVLGAPAPDGQLSLFGCDATVKAHG